MVDDPRDRLRGLGLVLQTLAAMFFIFPLSQFLDQFLSDRDIEFGKMFTSAVVPLVVVALQFATGWVLVHKRGLSLVVAIVHALTAIAGGMYLAAESSRDGFEVVAIAATIAVWPAVVCLAVARGPRTPYVPRRADLGGVLLAYGLTITLTQLLGVLAFLREYSELSEMLDSWMLLLIFAQPLALVVIGTFAILAGIEQSGGRRTGFSLLDTFLIVTLIITGVIAVLDTVAIVLSKSELRSLKQQIVIVAISVVYLLANPAVVWRYAANTKQLDVPDSAASAAGVRWALLFAMIAEAIHAVREISKGLDDWKDTVFALLTSAIVLLGLIVVALPTQRRAAMWCSLIASACAITIAAVMWFATKHRFFSAEVLWPNTAELALFLSLAWLNRPRVRTERPLAAVFE